MVNGMEDVEDQRERTMADDTGTTDAAGDIPDDMIPDEVLGAFMDVVGPALQDAINDALSATCDAHGYIKRERGQDFYETGRAQGREDGFLEGVRAALGRTCALPPDEREKLVLSLCMARDE